MIRDEYNNVVIKNESDGISNSFEYGKIQKSEATSYKDNKSDVRDELNPTTNRNNENVELGKNQTNNNDLVDKLVQAAETEAAATSTTATTAASSAAAATSAASASSSVVAGVTVVAVVGVSTLVGISVVSNNNASVQFKYLDVYPESISYVLNLYDTGDDHFSIYLENDNYLSYNDLVEGENEGNFSGLILGDTYRVYVKEESQSGKIIYDEKITTTDSGSHSLMNGLVWDKTANFKNLSFTVKIDYYDSEERYSDFKLTLENAKGIKTELELDATNEEQTVYVKPTADLEVVDIRKDALTYTFSFMEKDEEVIFDKGEVTFTDNSGGVVKFTDVNVNPSADLLSNEFQVTLDYVDDFDYLDNFYLIVTPVDGSLSSQRIELSKQLETQTVYIPKENGWPDKLYGLSLSYYVEFENDGITKMSTPKEVTFVDNQGRSQVTFNDVSIGSSVDLLSNEFQVTLNYIDDFNLLYSFSLNYRKAGTTDEFQTESLSKQTTAQSVYMPATEGATAVITPKLLDYMSLEYYVTYYNDDTLCESPHKTVTFEDSQGRTDSVFNGVTINESANLMGDTFEVTLDYNDDFGLLDNFVLYYNEAGSAATPTSYQLIKQKTPQTVTLSLPQAVNPGDGPTGGAGETENKLYGKSLSYYVTYSNNGQSMTSASKAVTFVDSQGREMSSFNDAVIDSSTDLLGNTFNITLDYTDDFDLISDIYLNYRPSESQDSYYRYGLTKQTTAQSVPYSNNFGSDLMDVSLDYYVDYSLDGVTGQTTGRTVTFTDSQNRRDSQLIDASIEESVDVMTNDIEVTLDYIDDFGFLDNFVLYYEDASAVVSDGYIEQELTKTTDPQTVSVFVNMERLLDVTFNYYVECENTRTGETLSTEIHSVEFVDSEGRSPTVFNSATINPYVDAASNVFQITLDYTDDYDFLDNFVLHYKLMDSPGDYPVDLVKQKTPQNIVLDSEIADDLYDLSLSYYVSYTNDGEQLQTSSEVVMFFDSDNREGPTFNDVTINPSVDVLGDTFQVTLDYVDYFNRLDNFTLFYRPYDQGFNYEEETLSKTTSAQTITLSSTFDLSKLYGLTLEYYVSYTRSNTQYTSSVKTVSFTDSLNRRETVFNDVTINPSVDVLSNEVSVTLDYIDDYDFLEQFTLCYEDESGMLQGVSIEKQLTAQTVELTGFDTLENVDLDYYVVYYNNGDQNVSDTNSVSFVDSQNRHSVFNSATINTAANFAAKTFEVTLNYTDDFNRFDNFEITLEDENDGTMDVFSLTKTTSAQIVDVSDSPINIWNGTFTINITYQINGEETMDAYEDTGVTFSNGNAPSFNSIDSDWGLIADDFNGQDIYYYLPIRLDFDDPAGEYGEMYMEINEYNDWPIYLDITTEWQYIDLTDWINENGMPGSVSLEIFSEMMDYSVGDLSAVSIYTYSTTISSTATAKIYSMTMVSESIYATRPTVEIKIVMSDPTGTTFSNFELVIIADNVTYTFTISMSGNIYTQSIGVDLSTEPDLIDVLRTNSCDIYLSYYDANEQDTLLMNSASGYWFEIT